MTGMHSADSSHCFGTSNIMTALQITNTAAQSMAADEIRCNTYNRKNVFLVETETSNNAVGGYFTLVITKDGQDFTTKKLPYNMVAMYADENPGDGGNSAAGDG